jgi:hypothetical protein
MKKMMAAATLLESYRFGCLVFRTGRRFRLYSESALIVLRKLDCFEILVQRQAFLGKLDQCIRIFEKRPSVELSFCCLAHDSIRLVEETHHPTPGISNLATGEREALKS